MPNKLIAKILDRPELQAQPPVLMDIGAAGALPKAWRTLAKYAICLAFEADERDLAPVEEQGQDFKVRYIYPKVATSEQDATVEFYLTSSPHCSSTLEPDLESLAKYGAEDLFTIQKRQKFPAVQLANVLKERHLDYVDWFKTDSQGTDLRLFKSLGAEIIAKVLVAEFEPGIIDAYQGEDKLYALMAYMDKQNFWLSDMELKGFVRAEKTLIKSSLRKWEIRFMDKFHKKAPGWAEVRYLNNGNDLSKRDLLLAWIFAMLSRQYFFAMKLAITGEKQFQDELFLQMQVCAKKIIRRQAWCLGFMVPAWLGRKIGRKLFGND